MDNPNNLADTYTTHVVDRETDARLEEFMRQQGLSPSPLGTTAQEPGTAPAPAPAAPGGIPSATGQPPDPTLAPMAPGPVAPPQQALPSTGTAIPKGPVPAPIATITQPGLLERIGSTAGSVTKDVATGIFESAPAVVGGVNDAVRNTVSSLSSLADWLNSNVVNLELPGTGIKAVDRPLDAIKDMLPEPVGAMKSVTGDMIRGATRFLIGFVPAMRVTGGGLVGAPIAGAVASYATDDPNQAGLSNLIQQFPALQNPVTEYLSTDPNSPEAVNRLKRSVEAAGFGLLAEGIVRGVRTIANARQAGVPEVPGAAPTGQPMMPSLTPEQMAQFTATADTPLVVKGSVVMKGMPNAPNPALTSADKIAKATAQTELGVPTDVAAKGLTRVIREADAPATKAGDLYINFARINTADDVKSTIDQMAQAFKTEIKASARDVQTNVQTKALADQLGFSVDDLLARQQGQTLNAEQSLATRRLLNTSAENMLSLAQKAAAPNAGEMDQFAFRRALALHHAIQSEAIAVRTETARALQSWSIPAGRGPAEALNDIKAMLMNSGDSTGPLAEAYSLLAQAGVQPGAMSVAVRRGWAATSKDMAQEAFTLGLLWRPTTHIRNVASNLITSVQQVYERGAAAKIGNVLGTAVENRVVDGEALAMTIGYLQSMKDAFRMSARAFMSGQSGAALNKVEILEPAITAARVAEARGLSAIETMKYLESPGGRVVDFLGHVNRFPGRVLAAGDEFFKTISYSAEINAQAVRKATQEGLSGKPLYERIAQLVNDPPEAIRMTAADQALYATFNNKPGEFTQAVMNLRQSGSVNPMFIVLPYVRTPSNIFRYTFERTPLAPLVGQWRGDIAAGGARRDLALARISTGSALMSIAFDYAASGVITGPGPSDKAERETLMRTGWQPYAFHVGNKYHKYSGTDPVAMPFAFAGAMADVLKKKDLSPQHFDTVSEIVAHGIAAIGKTAIDKSYLQGVAQFVQMIEEADRTQGVVNYMNRQSGSFLPMSSAFKAVKMGVDPDTREVNSPWDAIMAQIPGLSDKLPPARNLWGTTQAPQEVFGRAYDIAVPFAVSEKNNSPIDNEMARLNLGVERIGKSTSIDGVAMNMRDYPEVYDYYVRLAGNELKHPAYGLGAKDFLDSVVSGKSDFSDLYRAYSDGQVGGKAQFIKEKVHDFRIRAQKQLIAEAPTRFPDFYDAYSSQKQALGLSKQRFEEVQKQMTVTPRERVMMPPMAPSAPPRPGASQSNDRFVVPK